MSYLTSAQVAEMLGVSDKTIYRLAATDASFPVTRIGRTVRFEAAALDRWLRAHSRRKPGASDPQPSVTHGEAA